MKKWLFILLLVVLTGCGSRPVNWPSAQARFDGWALATDSPKGHLGSYLANGFLGLRLGPLGIGQGPDAARFLCLAGVYEQEKIARIPDWNRVDIYNGKRWFSENETQPVQPGLREDDRPVRPDLRAFSQTLDLKRGMLTTCFTWEADRRPVQVTSEMFLSCARPGIAVTRFTLETPSDLTLQVRFSLDAGQAAGEVIRAGLNARQMPAMVSRIGEGDDASFIALTLGAQFALGDIRAMSPDGVGDMKREAWSAFTLNCRKGHPVSLVRIASIAAGQENPSGRADREMDQALRKGWDPLKAEHAAAWGRLWESDIEIEGDAEAQQAVRTALFYLYSSARPGSRRSLPPMGLSSDIYAGHIFWDAEIWMYPVLLLLQPEMALDMLRYRLDRLPEARMLAKSRGFPGADFPWESAASGRETAPAEFSRERHVTAGVAWSLWRYFEATGDKRWLAREAWPALRDTADFWAARAEWNPARKRYEIKGVMTPDETAGTVDNSAWTNAMAQANLQCAARAARLLNRPVPSRWQEVAAKLWIPFDKAAGHYLEHDRYSGQTTKQADTELLIFPRRLPMPRKVQEVTFDFYAGKASKYGPAMTSSIHTVIAAMLGRREEAARYFEESYRPFLRPAFDLFSEKRTTDSIYFLTGASGMLQSVLYGFGGLSGEGDSLTAKPLLPPAWKRLTIRGLHWRGKRYQLAAAAGGKAELRKY
ncbi:MAG: glycoside hydrolase family 65 protein [Armatimonadetes bacterium]|nr:glycoside hydrolase family 65 protein [Armatimonadota bacterium]